MLLLASASPARRRLLLQAAIPHRVMVSGVDEEAIRDPDPVQLVQRLAQAKAKAVAAQLAEFDSSLPGTGSTASAAAESATPCSGVLGCDSLLVFAGEVFGKPADAAEALDRWRRMNGGRAELHTGHCLLRPGQPALLEAVTTTVVFAEVDEPTIKAYVATGEPLACAGGFALEGRGSLLVERIEGCFSNVIGLSLPLLRRWLVDFPGS